MNRAVTCVIGTGGTGGGTGVTGGATRVTTVPRKYHPVDVNF